MFVSFGQASRVLLEEEEQQQKTKKQRGRGMYVAGE
jgi:hypothetical protein